MPLLTENLAVKVASIEIDRNSISQARLDLATRPRTSVFPWRGQFSPGLVELLLAGRVAPGATIVDPFAGSGTTLHEGARLGLRSIGSEVNPTAWALATFARLASLGRAERKKLASSCYSRVARYTEGDLSLLRRNGDFEEVDSVFPLLKTLDYDERVVLTVTVLLAMGNEATLSSRALGVAFGRVSQTLMDLPESKQPIEMMLCDARELPIASGSVDAIITSPPYINVFNYHQNYRPAAERMGWRPLQAAPSEVGANRKHRGNRFLTVIQYAMDMLAALQEMKRLLKPSGFAAVVIGRESAVRGVSFQNGRLLAMLAIGGSGFAIQRWQERSFVSRFGGRIYEDILTLEPDEKGTVALPDFGRAVGTSFLESATASLDPDVRCDIARAVKSAASVESSPILPAQDGFSSCFTSAVHEPSSRGRAAVQT